SPHAPTRADLAPFDSVESSLEAKLAANRSGAPVANLERPGHPGVAREDAGHAQKLIESGGEKASVHAAGSALIGVAEVARSGHERCCGIRRELERRRDGIGAADERAAVVEGLHARERLPGQERRLRDA